MKSAICIRCGHAKRRSSSRCPNCKFRPETDRDLAKSLMLSLAYPLDYQVDKQDQAKSWDELLDIGRSIERGDYEFDDKEVDWLTKEAQKAFNLPVIEQIKLIGTPIAGIIVLIIIAYAVYYLSRD